MTSYFFGAQFEESVRAEEINMSWPGLTRPSTRLARLVMDGRLRGGHDKWSYFWKLMIVSFNV